MFNKIRMLFESRGVDAYDIEDAPLDSSGEEGDNSALASSQPPVTRPADIGENE